MSDYLGHLIERSFSPAPAVRPQLPSLFEAGHDLSQSEERSSRSRSPRHGPEQGQVEEPKLISDPGQEVTQAPLEICAEDGTPPASFPPNTASRHPVSFEPLVSKAPKSVDRESPVSIGENHHPKTDGDAALAPPEQKSVPGARPANHQARKLDSTQEDLGISIAASAVRSSQSPQTPFRRPGTDSSHVERELNQAPEPEPQRPSHSSNRAGQTQETIIAGPSPEARLGLFGRSAAHAITVRAGQLAARAEPANSPATINVTIGRVEVRAVPETKAKPLREPKTPMLSLEEYLRRRASGGRP